VICHQYGAYKNLREDKLFFGMILYLAGMLREKNINHIHSPWADQCAFAALIASRLLGIPFTVQARAHDIHRKCHLYALQEKFENAAFVVTNTNYNYSHIKSMLKERSSRKLFTIYEGLNLGKFEPNSIKQNISKNVKILSVARLIEEKGLIYLLKACNILKEKGFTFRCNIIGGTEEPFYTYYYLALKKLHRELNLEDCVFFLGAQPFKQVLEEYKKHDIFILPCVIARNGGRDISPNSLLEAMAMKMPVISTTIAAIPEIVDDGENGLLVPPNNENALADAAIKLIQDYNSRKTLGENARKKIEERFDIHKNLQQYFALLNGKNLI
jgi:glycosyltransferase involved in cell wall biosynthesis